MTKMINIPVKNINGDLQQDVFYSFKENGATHKKILQDYGGKLPVHVVRNHDRIILIDYDKEVKSKMDLWRKGLSSFPLEYAQYHEALAYSELNMFKSKGLIVHSTKLVRCGWGDGMGIIECVVEFPDGDLKKISWHDSHRTGGFMEHYKAGGRGSIDINKILENKE